MTSKDNETQPSGAGPGDALDAARAAAMKPRRDPLVSTLITVILVIVILTLVTVAYALYTGVFGTGAPRTMAEQKLMSSAAKVEAGSKEPADWMAYIIALTNDQQYRRAQEYIDKGAKTLKNQDVSADMLYMQANLYVAQGELDKALETADTALKTIKTAYEAGIVDSKKTGNPSPASAFGISQNYWELLLLKAEVYEKKSDWAGALKAYDEYLAGNKTAATVFAQRGAVKEQLKDNAGAEADFRQTLAFIPDNAEALAGLKRIGVAR